MNKVSDTNKIKARLLRKCLAHCINEHLYREDLINICGVSADEYLDKYKEIADTSSDDSIPQHHTDSSNSRPNHDLPLVHSLMDICEKYVSLRYLEEKESTHEEAVKKLYEHFTDRIKDGALEIFLHCAHSFDS